MSGTATVDELMDLAARRFKRERASLVASGDVFESLGVDSMQVMELLTELESHFDIEIPDYELRDVRTFAELAVCIDRRK
ncbi:MAG TPA: acyl carrier protein [Polyangiales bacterium]|nr:acyl carrier protein [Polyangiales bacterium]